MSSFIPNCYEAEVKNPTIIISVTIYSNNITILRDFLCSARAFKTRVMSIRPSANLCIFFTIKNKCNNIPWSTLNSEVTWLIVLIDLSYEWSTMWVYRFDLFSRLICKSKWILLEFGLYLKDGWHFTVWKSDTDSTHTISEIIVCPNR